MAETKDPQKSLEMRVAELEDKLSQMHISEQDMQTYQRVAAKLGVAQQPTTAPQAAISPIYYHCYYYHCYYFRCYYYNDCILGPQGTGGPAGGGGGFGGFGR